MSRIKVVQIGMRHEHADGKFRTLKLLEEFFEIVGVVDEASFCHSATPVKLDESIYAGYPRLTLEQVWSYPGLQAVFVEVPNDDLITVARQVMEHNLPMHLDKPTGMDPTAFKEIVTHYHRNNIPFQMGYMFRVNPALKWVREALAKGWLGEICQFDGSMNHNYGHNLNDYQGYLGTFQGGIMYNLGCHIADAIVALMGRPQSIHCCLRTTPGQAGPEKDNTLAVLEYPNAFATINACAHDPSGRRRFRICCTKALIEICPCERFDNQPLMLELVIKAPIPGYEAGTHMINCGVVRDRYEEQAMELRAMILGEAANPWSLEHELAVADTIVGISGGSFSK